MGDIGVTGLRPIVHAPTVRPRPKAIAQAAPAQSGSKPGSPPIGQGSGADIPSPTNVSKDEASQNLVSRLIAEIVDYEMRATENLRKSNPDNWAELQKNLGIAHIRLGNEYEKLGVGKEEELKKALMALDKAFNVFKSNNAARAEIQKYRGIALIRFGGTEDLNKALTEFNEAFKVFNSNSDTAKCAEIQDDIGLALASLAKNKWAHAETSGDVNELKAAKKLLESAAEAIKVAIDLGLNAQTKALAQAKALDAKDDARIKELNISLLFFQRDMRTVQTLIEKAEFRIAHWN